SRMHENVPVRFGRGRLDSLATKGLAAYLIAYEALEAPVRHSRPPKSLSNFDPGCAMARTPCPACKSRSRPAAWPPGPNPCQSTFGESPPTAPTLGFVSYHERRDRGRLRNGHDRLERQRGANSQTSSKCFSSFDLLP